MKIDLASSFKHLFVNLFNSIKRYPEAIVTAFLTTIMLIVINHLYQNPASVTGLFLWRLTMILALGFPMSLCLKSLQERKSSQGKMRFVGYWLLAVLFLFSYFMFMLKTLQPVPVIRYIAFTAAFYLLAPVLAGPGRPESFERFCIFLLSRLLTTLLYALVLYLGLIAILFAINTLFQAGISDKFYADLFTISFCSFAPLFFLADIPKPNEPLAQTAYPKALKIMLLYILIPVIAAYTLILYAYSAKILILQNWPEGMVTNLVLWYALACTTVLFLLFPIRKSESYTTWIFAILPKVLLPLILMMFVAISIRIRNYGMTESRFFVLVAGAWMTGALAYMSVVRQPRNIFLPLTAALLAILSVTGPWSSFSISVISQNGRFENLLVKNKILQNGSLIPAKTDLTEDDRKELSAIIYYFKEFHSYSELRHCPAYFNIFQTQRVYGFTLWEDHKKVFRDLNFFNQALAHKPLLKTKGYDFIADITFDKPTDFHAIDSNITIDYSSRTKTLKVYRDHQLIYTGHPDAMAVNIYKAYNNKIDQGVKEMTQEDQSGTLKVKYLFTRIQGYVSKKSGKVQFEALQFYVFIKL